VTRNRLGSFSIHRKVVDTSAGNLDALKKNSSVEFSFLLKNEKRFHYLLSTSPYLECTYLKWL
jgi:hypothetical protein